jgi:large subunit ribosomal protein L33
VAEIGQESSSFERFFEPAHVSLAERRAAGILRAPNSESLVMREIIQIVSSAGTGYRYYTTKNKRTTPDKLTLKKYDPIARKHVEFVEKKMPSPKK